MLVDTNVVLDVLLERKPHVTDSDAVLAAVERNEVAGLLGATSITTIYYLAAKAVGAKRAKAQVAVLLDIFRVAAITGSVLRDAMDSEFVDFEDAVLHAAAMFEGADAIVTRDPDDFRRAKLAVYTPSEFRAALRRK